MFSAEILIAKKNCSQIVNCGIVGELFSAGFLKFIKKLFYGKLFLFFSLDIKNDFSVHHHDQAVAVSNGVLHVMCDHQCSKVIAVDNPVCDIQHLGSCVGVKGCSMLLKKEKLWLLKGCHEKRKCLSLTS